MNEKVLIDFYIVLIRDTRVSASDNDIIK